MAMHEKAMRRKAGLQVVAVALTALLALGLVVPGLTPAWALAGQGTSQAGAHAEAMGTDGAAPESEGAASDGSAGSQAAPGVVPGDDATGGRLPNDAAGSSEPVPSLGGAAGSGGTEAAEGTLADEGSVPDEALAAEGAPTSQGSDTGELSPLPRPALPEGTYVLRSALAERQVVDVAGGSAADGARLQLYRSNMTGAQCFAVTYQDGWAIVANAATGKVVDVQGAQAVAGAPVQMYAPNGTAAQRWRLQENADGSYGLVSVLGEGLALDVAGAWAADGAPLQLWEANGTAAQRFFLMPVTPEVEGTATVPDGFYVLTSAVNGTSALDVQGASRESGARAQLWAPNGTLAQRFEVKGRADGTYTIRPAHSAAALEADGGNLVPTTPALQRPFAEGSRAQRWCLVAQPDGTMTVLSAANGLALDVEGASSADGATVQLYTPNGTVAQRWALVPVTAGGMAEGICAIVPACAPSRALDVAGASLVPGANVQSYSANQTLAQRFEATQVEGASGAADARYAFRSLLNGYFLTDCGGNVALQPAGDAGAPALAQQWEARLGFGGTVLASCATSRVLDVAGAQDADGANVGTYAPNGTLAQGFAVQPARALAEGRTYAVRTAVGDWQLSVGGDGKEPGAPIQLSPVGDEGSQKFVASYREGRLVLTNPASGQCMDVKDGADEPGTPLQQWPANGCSAQEFSLAFAGDGTFFLTSATGMAVQPSRLAEGARLELAAPDGAERQRFRFVEVAPYVRLSGDAELDAIVDDLLDHQIGREGDALGRAFRYVASYRYLDGSKWPTGNWSVPFAKEMYYNQGGNCYRFAALFCWLARGLGYDASVVAGEVPSRSMGWAPHGWVEVVLDGTTYVCDPDMANAIPSRNWFMVTYANAPVDYRK